MPRLYRPCPSRVLSMCSCAQPGAAADEDAEAGSGPAATVAWHVPLGFAGNLHECALAPEHAHRRAAAGGESAEAPAQAARCAAMPPLAYPPGARGAPTPRTSSIAAMALMLGMCLLKSGPCHQAVASQAAAALPVGRPLARRAPVAAGRHPRHRWAPSRQASEAQPQLLPLFRVGAFTRNAWGG